MVVSPRAPHGTVVRLLLLDAIDYAGLFPPAQLDMPGAVSEYASYLDSDETWALGGFVVPASRLDELATEARAQLDESWARQQPKRWRLNALFGPDVAADMQRVDAFNAAHSSARDGWSATVHGVELRAATPDAVATALHVVPDSYERFVEIPITGDTRTLIRAICDAGGFAKVRTGGTTADAFPSSADLARFLATCISEGVRFKATAGLHHPLRGDYSLTYEPGSAVGRMYGFLNVALASSFLSAGMTEADARALLEETDAGAFQFDDSGVTWRGRHLSASELSRARDRTMQSFGSCSFREPIDDLTALGML